MGRELERLRQPPMPLMGGQEWWVDNPHRLSARVRGDRRVVELGRWELAPGLHGSLVRRLRPRPPAWRRPALLVATGTALVGLALLMLAAVVQGLLEVLRALAPTLLAALVGWVLIRLVKGHRATCTGLHCPGCRG